MMTLADSMSVFCGCVFIVVGCVFWFVSPLIQMNTLTFHASLCRACGESSLPLTNDDYVSVWSVVFAPLCAQTLSEVFSLCCASVTCRRSKRWEESDARCDRALTCLFVVLNFGSFIYGSVEYFGQITSSASSFFCHLLLIASCLCYKGIFGSFWRLSLGVFSLSFTPVPSEKIIWEVPGFCESGMWLCLLGPLALFCLTLLLAIPLLVIFLPLTVLFSFGFFLVDFVAYRFIIAIADKTNKITGGISQINQGSEHLNKLASHILFTSIFLLLWILLLFSPFYAGTSWVNVSRDSFLFFVPHWDFSWPNFRQATTANLSLLSAEIFMRFMAVFYRCCSSRPTAVEVDTALDTIQQIAGK